jgi:hypothetical protein
MYHIAYSTTSATALDRTTAIMPAAIDTCSRDTNADVATCTR